MNHLNQPTEPTPRAPVADTERSTRAAERRRLLLKGVGRGSAVLAAAVPLKTLATVKIITNDSTQCTVSGMQSGVHSVTPGSPVCSGFQTSSWGQVNFLGVPVKTWPTGVNRSAACNTVFTRCTLKGADGKSPATLFEVVSKYPTSDDAHWVCAWLNAQVSGQNFPYSTVQVVGFYAANNASTTNALSFFKKYTELKA